MRLEGVTRAIARFYNAGMFRILLICLLLANVVLAGYQFSKPADLKPAKTTVAKAAVVSPDSDVPTIHLFSELMDDQGLLNGSRQCFTLGPFHSDENLLEFFEQLSDVTLSIKERQSQALVEKGYWVYLPPYASLLEANKVLLRLQAIGYKDLAVIYEGELEKSISLGYFLRQGNALRRKNSVESKGYAPQMQIQRDAEDRFWLDYEQLPGSGFVALDMAGRPNDFMQRAMPCAEQKIVEAPELQANVSETPAPQDGIETDSSEPEQAADEPQPENP